MIEGIKVTLEGTELRDLLEKQVDHHEERLKWYRSQIESLKAGGAESHGYTNGNPIKNLEDSETDHLNNARELAFIADHVAQDETYLLDRNDLMRLGIIKSRY